MTEPTESNPGVYEEAQITPPQTPETSPSPSTSEDTNLSDKSEATNKLQKILAEIHANNPFTQADLFKWLMKDLKVNPEEVDKASEKVARYVDSRQVGVDETKLTGAALEANRLALDTELAAMKKRLLAEYATKQNSDPKDAETALMLESSIDALKTGKDVTSDEITRGYIETLVNTILPQETERIRGFDAMTGPNGELIAEPFKSAVTKDEQDEMQALRDRLKGELNQKMDGSQSSQDDNAPQSSTGGQSIT